MYQLGKTIVIANQKGGVGKTTTAVNLSAALAAAGKRPLLIDMDPQANASSGFGISRDDINNSSYELLLGEADADDCILKNVYKKLCVIPSDMNLAAAEIELTGIDRKEYLLRDAIGNVKSKYDYILIDCPPSLGILTLNGLAAADSVLVPMQCEYFALEGITLLLQTVQKVQKGINPDLKIGGIFFTMYDSRTRLAQDVVMQVKSYFKDVVFNTIIPRNVRLSEAPSHGLPICKYDPECVGARSYAKLAEEVIRRG